MLEPFKYRIRWLARAWFCQYNNWRPDRSKLEGRTLIEIHQRQKENHSHIAGGVSPVQAKEIDGKALALRMGLVGTSYGACLEIGCESGWFLDCLLREEKIKSAIGIDLRKNEMVGKAGPSKDLIASSAEALPFKNTTFELVVAFHVIEHLRDLTKFRAEMERVTWAETDYLIALPIGWDEDPCHRWHFMTAMGWKRFLRKRLGLQFISGGVFKTHSTEFLGLFRKSH